VHQNLNESGFDAGKFTRDRVECPEDWNRLCRSDQAAKICRAQCSFFGRTRSDRVIILKARSDRSASPKDTNSAANGRRKKKRHQTASAFGQLRNPETFLIFRIWRESPVAVILNSLTKFVTV
jgi:hypothetical protein